MPRAHENNITDNKIMTGMIFFIRIKCKSKILVFLLWQNIKKNRKTKAFRCIYDYFEMLFNSLLFNPGTFTASVAQKIQFRTAHLTYFMQFDAINIGRKKWE
jgi:hypothetical protein